MKRELSITYNWWNNHNKNQPIKKEHIGALEETAVERICKMQLDGFTSGELWDNIHMAGDPEDGVDYRGWWSIKNIDVD